MIDHAGEEYETRGAIRTEGPWFKDAADRTLLLRGVNLGGSTKVPYTPNGATHIKEGFYDHRNVSFVGRPFPIEEADEHLGRLRSWGLTFLRLLTTWEAVEHAGPGQYDEEYLAYLRAVVEKAAGYGIDVFIDPHQDVWSRWTGGDGAPGWTLEALGMDLTKLAPTAAAITHQTWGDPFPRMIWPSNYSRLGCATMFTLFFGGNTFAPSTKIDGEPAQEYLQGHFINAMVQVARTLKGLPNVVGYDSLNEPGAGYIGMDDITAHSGFALLRSGPTPTPFEGMLLGSGRSVEVGVWEQQGPETTQVGKQTLNPEGLSLWREGYEDVWKQNGVWGEDGELLRPDHFKGSGGGAQGFANEYLKPFISRYAQAIREVDPNALIFLEGTPGGAHPHWGAPGDPGSVVNAAHWYDVVTLFMKSFNPEVGVDMSTGQPVFGRDAVQRSYAAQLGAIRQSSAAEMGNIPTLIGEFGLPFDLNEGAAYESGDFSSHVAALDSYVDAMDEHLLNFTLWNYTADNTNERGDQWNGEDLSIFSRDQQTDPADLDSGGRALEGVVRPYALKTAGEPLRMTFDLETRTFTYEFRPDPNVTEPTEVFVPELQYPGGYDVEVTSDGEYVRDEASQLLLIHVHHTDGPVSVRITPPTGG
ncbi:MAG: cellulase family glycosylhydrolase [Chloroflexota bacterium]|nr:cellulase family glycosylhydrolase [Chloroflexota bacterium]